MPERARVSSAHISPSAHYTGYVWYRHQLSDPTFVTPFGRFVHRLLWPLSWGARAGFGLDIERLLLQRHLQIDALLRKAIEQDGVCQVVEIACGLSPRGRRFRQHYPHVRYVEADLPAMAARKRLLLREAGWLSLEHQVRSVDILAERGTHGLASLFAELDHRRPLLVITEGLVNYFPLAVVEAFWTRLAEQLRGFAEASYVTDLYPDLREHPRYRQLRWGVELIGRLTRGSYPLHYRDHAEIVAGFQRCGFRQAQVLDPAADSASLGLEPARAPGLVRVIQARV